MDSVTLLKKLLVEGKEVLVLNFSYGSKHNKKERRALLDVCDVLNVPVYLYDLPVNVSKYIPNTCNQEVPESLLASNLLKTGEAIPEGHYEEANMRQTVVPFRNGIMLSIAVGFAESHGCTAVYYGNHAGDNTNYPDCRSDFVNAIGNAAVLGTFEGIEIRSLFVNMTKTDIAKMGIEIGAPLELTWSCYNGQRDRPCLRCCTCIERCEAFFKTGAKDPALTMEEWDQGVKNMKKVVDEFNKDHKEDIKSALDYQQEQSELHG
jgi:7-cyano-7-deazaguanine synthase